MTAATSTAMLHGGHGTDHPAALTIDQLVLLRIAAAAATRAELQRDLAALVAPQINGTQFRRAAELAIGTLSTQHVISETRGRLSATPAGLRATAALLAPHPLGDAGWDSVRQALLARALGLATLSPALVKALARPEGIAALVLQRHFGLNTDKPLSPTNLRAELAVVALEKAFGNKIKTGLGKGSGLPGKAGRVLAGQLFKSPRECATDGKLVLALAAEVASAPDQTLDGLRLALLRRLTGGARAAASGTTATGVASPPTTADRPNPPTRPDRGRDRVHDRLHTRSLDRSPSADNDAVPLASAPVRSGRGPVRPDMQEFSATVVSAARPVSEGWPGNRKAFISLVWTAIRDTRPEWELSEVAFKGMLAEAHRSGHVVLAGADLKEKCDLKELEDSKILYKNTVWHFVRVED